MGGVLASTGARPYNNFTMKVIVFLILISNFQHIYGWESKSFKESPDLLLKMINIKNQGEGKALIQVHLNQSFTLKQLYLDPIDLQVEASARQTNVTHRGLDPGSSSIARLMWGFVPVQERVRFLKNNAHTAMMPQSLDSSGLSDAFRASLTRQSQSDFKTWFFESGIEKEKRRVLMPGFHLILRDSNGLSKKEITGQEPGHLEITSSSGNNARILIPYTMNGKTLSFSLDLEFEPGYLSLGLFNEESTLIAHAGGKSSTDLRGAYLIIPKPEILPLVTLNDD